MTSDVMQAALATWAAKDIPARLHAAQVAKLLNCSTDDVAILASAGKLRALGKPKPNSVKFFSSIELITLLADPDWPNKVRRGERERIVRCDYCNVCKHLDGTHMRVICALWPQGALQAPPDDRGLAEPQWGAAGANLTVAVGDGRAVLKWNKAAGAARYDVCRTDSLGNVRIVDAVKVARWEDRDLLAGMPYRYHVRAYGAAGQGGASSNAVTVTLPLPAYAADIRAPAPAGAD